MESIKKYGNYGEYLVGIHEDKEKFLIDVNKFYKLESYIGEIVIEDIQEGKIYGSFADDVDSRFIRFMGGYIGKEAVDVGLFEIHGSCTKCFYIDIETINIQNEV